MRNEETESVKNSISGAQRSPNHLRTAKLVLGVAAAILTPVMAPIAGPVLEAAGGPLMPSSSLNPTAGNCPGQNLGRVLWTGTFRSSKSALPMVLTLGYSGRATLVSDRCEARCQVVHTEFRARSRQPKLMQLDCQGEALKGFRMPVFIEWQRASFDSTQASIRLGSVLGAVVQSRMRLSPAAWAPPIKHADTSVPRRHVEVQKLQQWAKR
jgi:hypothetical protein